MAHLRQQLPLPSSVPYPPSPPLLPTKSPPRRIPLRAAWTSLTPTQQQHLLHQLVKICCELLRSPLLATGKEDAHDTE